LPWQTTRDRFTKQWDIWIIRAGSNKTLGMQRLQSEVYSLGKVLPRKLTASGKIE